MAAVALAVALAVEVPLPVALPVPTALPLLLLEGKWGEEVGVGDPPPGGEGVGKALTVLVPPDPLGVPEEKGEEVEEGVMAGLPLPVSVALTDGSGWAAAGGGRGGSQYPRSD